MHANRPSIDDLALLARAQAAEVAGLSSMLRDVLAALNAANPSSPSARIAPLGPLGPLGGGFEAAAGFGREFGRSRSDLTEGSALRNSSVGGGGSGDGGRGAGGTGGVVLQILAEAKWLDRLSSGPSGKGSADPFFRLCLPACDAHWAAALAAWDEAQQQAQAGQAAAYGLKGEGVGPEHGHAPALEAFAPGGAIGGVGDVGGGVAYESEVRTVQLAKHAEIDARAFI